MNCHIISSLSKTQGSIYHHKYTFDSTTYCSTLLQCGRCKTQEIPFSQWETLSSKAGMGSVMEPSNSISNTIIHQWCVTRVLSKRKREMSGCSRHYEDLHVSFPRPSGSSTGL